MHQCKVLWAICTHTVPRQMSVSQQVVARKGIEVGCVLLASSAFLRPRWELLIGLSSKSQGLDLGMKRSKELCGLSLGVFVPLGTAKHFPW